MFQSSRTPIGTFNGSSRLLLRPVPTRLAFPSRLIGRNNTTAAVAIPNNVQAKLRSIWMRRLLYAALFGGLGYYTGQFYTSGFLYPATPGSSEDEQQMERILKLVDYLPIVRKLRADPKYVEWDAYDNLTEEAKERRLTSGPLKGSRGLAVQRIFWNEEDKECVNVIHFGHSMDGWPTVVHGGLLATVLDESLGRVAIRSVPARTGVTAHLNINYRKHVSSGEFYTIHTRLDTERSTDRKAYVSGEVRSLMGQLCCESDALFVVPKNLGLRKIGDRF